MRLCQAPDKGLLEPIETASRDEIAALQTRRLAAALRYAYDNVRPIRAKFDAERVHPADFRGLADLTRFPFTAKADLRTNYPFGLLAVPKNELARAWVRSTNWSISTNVPGCKLSLNEPQAESETRSVTPTRLSTSMFAR